jgi:hypothetical protein
MENQPSGAVETIWKLENQPFSPYEEPTVCYLCDQRLPKVPILIFKSNSCVSLGMEPRWVPKLKIISAISDILHSAYLSDIGENWTRDRYKTRHDIDISIFSCIELMFNQLSTSQISVWMPTCANEVEIHRSQQPSCDYLASGIILLRSSLAQSR